MKYEPSWIPGAWNEYKKADNQKLYKTIAHKEVNNGYRDTQVDTRICRRLCEIF